MTQVQAATLSARILCAWFAYEAFHQLLAAVSMVSLMTTVPFRVIGGVTSSHAFDSMYRSELIGLLSFAVDVVLAVLFYRCGPGVIGFLTGATKDDPASQA
jgi:hypothetical protein